jgi:hypothetical protein
MPGGASSARRAAKRVAVPTGTVDFPTTRQSSLRLGASPCSTVSIWLRSAPNEPGSCGVPTQMKCTSAKLAASATEVLNRSFPDRTVERSSSARPGS